MDLKLDSSGDLEVIDGEFSLTSGSEAVAQELRQRLLFFLGEWFLDTRLGVDWFGIALVKAPDWKRMEQMIRQVVRGTEGIKTVRKIDFDFDAENRSLALEIDAELEDLSLYTFSFSELLLLNYQGQES